MKFLFTKMADSQRVKIQADEQARIYERLLFWKLNIQAFRQNLKVVKGLEPANFRLRVGKWRMLVSWDSKNEVCLILKTGLRKNIYG